MVAWVRTLLSAVCLAAAAPVSAATCNDPGGFEKWLGDIRREAVAQGLSPAAINAALSGVTYDPEIIRRDRGQRFFQQSFEQFSAKMVPPYRVQKGTALLNRVMQACWGKSNVSLGFLVRSLSRSGASRATSE